jgi:hypothetical protein
MRWEREVKICESKILVPRSLREKDQLALTLKGLVRKETLRKQRSKPQIHVYLHWYQSKHKYNGFKRREVVLIPVQAAGVIPIQDSPS